MTDNDKLTQLGNLAIGLQREEIMALSSQSVLKNLNHLSLFPLTNEQAEAVLDKIEDAMP